MRAFSRCTAVSTVLLSRIITSTIFVGGQRVDIAAARIHRFGRQLLPFRSRGHRLTLTESIFSARFKECSSAASAPRLRRRDTRRRSAGTRWSPPITCRRSTPRSQAILRKVLRGNNGICSRLLALDDLERSVRARSRCARCAIREARAARRGASRPPGARRTRHDEPGHRRRHRQHVHRLSLSRA